MKDLITFFYAIGIYNLVGVAVLYAMINDNVSKVVFKLCETFREPHEPSKESRFWLWWTATLNLGYGAANVAAVRWDVVAQKDLMIANIVFYGFFIVLSFFAWRSETYARGILTNFPLFGFWMCWAIYVYCNNFC